MTSHLPVESTPLYYYKCGWYYFKKKSYLCWIIISFAVVMFDKEFGHDLLKWSWVDYLWELIAACLIFEFLSAR